MRHYRQGASALAILVALGASQAHAAEAETATAGATDAVDAIIVTGTRLTGLRAIDSAAPVEVLDAGTLTRTGRPDLGERAPDVDDATGGLDRPRDAVRLPGRQRVGRLGRQVVPVGCGRPRCSQHRQTKTLQHQR